MTPLYRHLKASRLYVTPITEGVRQSIDILLWRFVIRLLQVFVLRNSDQLSWRGNMVLQHSKQSNLLLHMEPPWQRSLLLTWLCIWAAHSGGRLFLLTVNHVNIIRRDITNYVRRVTHRCQPSRIRMSRVPRNETNVPHSYTIALFFFAADYFTFLPCDATKWRTSNKARSILRKPTDAVYISLAAAVINDCLFFNAARRQHIATVSDMPWMVDWKNWPRREIYKFNDDWRSHFAWIAKLSDSGMAQCNRLCDGIFDIVWWSHGCSPAPRECTPR